MLQKRLPKQALLAKVNGKRPVGRPKTRWTNYIDDLGENRLRLHPSEMMEVNEDRKVWRLNSSLCPRNPHSDEKRRRSTFQTSFISLLCFYKYIMEQNKRKKKLVAQLISST